MWHGLDSQPIGSRNEHRGAIGSDCRQWRQLRGNPRVAGE